jgi:hypothetical protein
MQIHDFAQRSLSANPQADSLHRDRDSVIEFPVTLWGTQPPVNYNKQVNRRFNTKQMAGQACSPDRPLVSTTLYLCPLNRSDISFTF